ncbi:unnamed protein product, partial [Nesidiocoris tenuis]
MPYSKQFLEDVEKISDQDCDASFFSKVRDALKILIGRSKENAQAAISNCNGLERCVREFRSLQSRSTAASSFSNARGEQMISSFSRFVLEAEELLGTFEGLANYQKIINIVSDRMFSARDAAEEAVYAYVENAKTAHSPRQSMDSCNDALTSQHNTLTALQTLTALSTAIPEFSGEVLEFDHFQALFQNCVNDLDVPDPHKLQVLITKLTGRMKQWVLPYIKNRRSFQEVWNNLVREFTDSYETTLARLDKVNDIPTITNDRPEVLQAFIQSVEAYASSVNAMKQSLDMADLMVYHQVIRRLPPHLHKTFYDEKIANTQALPTVRNLISFLQSRVIRNQAVIDKSTAPERRSSPLNTFTRSPARPSSPRQMRHSFGSNAVSKIHVNSQPSAPSPTVRCPRCLGDHFLYRCREFALLGLREKWDFVSLINYCTNCLSSPHDPSSCLSRRNCATCQRRHHSLLHNTDEVRDVPVSEISGPINQASDPRRSTSNIQDQTARSASRARYHQARHRTQADSIPNDEETNDGIYAHKFQKEGLPVSSPQIDGRGFSETSPHQLVSLRPPRHYESGAGHGVATADIRQMFRQIQHLEADRNFLRIVWRESPTKPIQDYRLTTVTYGTSSAPFLACRVLNELATQSELTYPIASQILKNSTYVDDLHIGGDTIQSALQARSQIVQVLDSACLELRKWAANDSRLLEGLPKEHLLSAGNFVELGSEEDQQFKILGVIWKSVSDTFSYRVSPPAQIATKRQMASQVGQVYDPVGWIIPVAVYARLIQRDVIRLKLDWDEQLPETIISKWKVFADSLQTLQSLSFPRHIPNSKGPFWLAAFADASEKAYAAVIYIITLVGSQPCVRLLTARARVAPIQMESLPRLELMACSLLADTLKRICQTIPQILPNQIFCFSDSTIALSWITANPAPVWKP